MTKKSRSRRWIRRFVKRRQWDLIGFIEEFGILDAELRGKIDPDAPYTWTILAKVVELLQMQWGGFRHFHPLTLRNGWACSVSPLSIKR
jgi:hypothetical protein